MMVVARSGARIPSTVRFCQGCSWMRDIIKGMDFRQARHILLSKAVRTHLEGGSLHCMYCISLSLRFLFLFVLLDNKRSAFFLVGNDGMGGCRVLRQLCMCGKGD